MSDNVSILVIDDDVTVRGLVEARLGGRDGHEVLTAADGASGLKIAASLTPNLILLDWMMPGMDGLEVLARLKEHSKTARIPVYMLTAKGMMADVETAFSLGADGYFTKPISLDQLSQRVGKALAQE